MAQDDTIEPRDEATQEPRVDTEPGAEAYDLTLNRATNQLILRNQSTGRSISLSAKLQELSGEGGAEGAQSLSPAQFRSALDRLDSLGLIWKAEPFPSLKAKPHVSDDVFATEEYRKIREEYPRLPQEISQLVAHELMEAEWSAASTSELGSPEDIEEKAAIVRERVITPEFRSEFFFKQAIKVPYLTDVDWEVVFKLSERNVKGCPGLAYALLTLNLHEPYRQHVTSRTTVAVNHELLDRLIALLTEARDNLKKAQKWTEVLRQATLKDAQDGVLELSE